MLLLTDIYAAGEEPIEGVTAEALARAIGERGHRHAAYAGDLKAATERLSAEVQGGRRGPDPGRGQRVDGGRRAPEEAGRMKRRREDALKVRSSGASRSIRRWTCR